MYIPHASKFKHILEPFSVILPMELTLILSVPSNTVTVSTYNIIVSINSHTWSNCLCHTAASCGKIGGSGLVSRLLSCGRGRQSA